MENKAQRNRIKKLKLKIKLKKIKCKKANVKPWKLMYMRSNPCNCSRCRPKKWRHSGKNKKDINEIKLSFL